MQTSTCHSRRQPTRLRVTRDRVGKLTFWTVEENGEDVDDNGDSVEDGQET